MNTAEECSLIYGGVSMVLFIMAAKLTENDLESKLPNHFRFVE